MTALSPRRAFAVVLTGMLLVQAAWILALPAYRGIDEFDHVFKAAGVVRGELTSTRPAPHGRGGLVPVPRSIVEAASAVCEWYPYTQHDNCHPAADLGDGLVEVASAASAYNPAWYAVAGLPTLVLGGDAAVYAMRVLAALSCALLLAWGAAITASWSRNAWPLLAYCVALTPVMAYSTAVAAPNGLHYAGALLLWSAAVAAVTRRSLPLGLVAPIAVASLVLLLTHTTGPLWLALTAVSLLPLLGVRLGRRLGSSTLRRVLLALGVLLVVLLGSVVWTHLSSANALGPPDPSIPPLTVREMLRSEVLWVLQGIGAFPVRNEPAPMIVYPLWLLPLGTLLVMGVRAASRRRRASMALVALFSVVVPTVLTVIAYPAQGLAWQGRYTLPLLFGLTTLSALALTECRPAPPRVPVIVAAAMMALATAISVGHIALSETGGEAPGVPAVAVLPLGWLLVALVSAAGVLLPVVALVRAPSPARELHEVS